MIQLYRDEGSISKDGEKVKFQNSAHLWWVRFPNGVTRPATETEIELWQRLQVSLKAST